MRVFTTQAAYDAYRTSLGDANVFPPASSLFMSFDKDILTLYTRGNDTGGRCLSTATSASLDGEAVTVDLSWQSGTCGAPISAHYPFILVSLSRTAADGSTWTAPTRSVCASAASAADTRACATLAGAATSAPTSTPSPASTAAPSTPTPAPTATRTLTPSAPVATTPVAVASPTPAATVAPTATRSPVAAASPAPAANGGTNYVLYGALIAAGLLIGIALMLSRGSPRRGR